MSNALEDRLRTALRERAADFPADPDAWARIRARNQAAGARRGLRRWSRAGRIVIPAAAAAAVVAVVVLVTAAVSGVTGRSAGAPAGGARPGSSTPGRTGPATASPKPGGSQVGPYSPGGPPQFFLAEDPPVSAILALRVSPAAAGPTSPSAPRAVTAYSWLAYTSPSAWLDLLQGRQFCHDVVYPDGSSSGFCVPLPQLGAGRLAAITASTDMGAKIGPVVVQGAAASQVTSVTAVLPGGRTIAGMVKTGRGFPWNVWAVAYPRASSVRLVFRDAAGTEVAALDSAGPTEPPQLLEPGSGGILTFTYPQVPGIPDHSVNAYLIDGYVGFWPGPGNNGYLAPQLAAGPPALAGLSLGFWAPGGTKRHSNSAWESFGYAHADVARVVLRLPNGERISASTFAAWPGSGLRLWAVRLPAHVPSIIQGVAVITATGYDAAGNVVAQVTLGSGG